jgi:GntR family transcriptional regulator
VARKKDSRPRHQQIAAELRAAIMSGVLAPGQRLPTTQELASRYQVTGQTVQRTLKVLKEEGFIVGRAGVGVYVRDETPLTLQPASYFPPAGEQQPYRWISEAERRSQRGSTRLVTVGEAVPPPEVARELGIEAGQRAALRHQVLLLDDEPAELVWNYFPMEIARGTPLLERKKIRGGSPRLLADLGYPAREHVDRVSARLATTEEFEALELPDDVPVLRTLRTVYTDRARPVEVSILIKGAHRYELLYRDVIG